MGELNPMYKRENLRLLRRALRLTQKEFIDRFLSDEEGKPTMSIATLSNLEAKDGPRMNDVIISVSEQLGIDSMHFSMPSEEFADAATIENISPALKPQAGFIYLLHNIFNLPIHLTMISDCLVIMDNILYLLTIQ